MNTYALTVVLKNELDEKARKELLDGFTKRFGKAKKEDVWGSRDLAYEILHHKKGYYTHYEFEAEPSAIAPLDNALKLEEDVLRYLIIRL
jgi:small subunit ribosomal protein S6